MTEGKMSLDRPSLVDLKAGLARFSQPFSPFHSDSGLEVGLTEKDHRLFAHRIAIDAWKCFA